MRGTPVQFLLVLAVAATLGAAGWAEGAAPASASRAPNPPVLAGSEIEYPPYCILGPDGQVGGFSVELLRAALKAVGRDVTFRVGPWAQLKDDLAAGRLQALPLVGRTPEREALFDFTFPYLTMHGTIVVRDDNTTISTLADLDGRQVAVLRGDYAEEYLRHAQPGAVVVPLRTFAIALQELSAGRHDAVVIQKLLALQLMRTAGLRNLKTVGPPLQEFVQSFCFAVREGDSGTLAALNEGLAIVIADGTFHRLHTTWFADLEALGRARSRIVVGGDGSYPPFEFLDANRQPAGFNVDLTRAIARQTGLLIEIRLGAWAEIRRSLEIGDVDALQGMFYSAERDRQLGFSPPHSFVAHAIVVRRGGPEPANLASLTGKAVLVQRGDLMHDLAVESNPGIRIVPVPSQEEALALLASGVHDAALVAKMPALFLIDKKGWRNLKVLDVPLLSAEYCYAVPHGHDELLGQLSDGLAAVKASGEYRRIQAKWLGPYEPVRPSLKMIATYALIGILPLLALLLGSLLWSRTLQRQVASRTRELTREISERQAAEEQLFRSQKMEAIALLAGGVAHNFNNILQSIGAQIGLAQMKMASQDPIRARLNQAASEIRRAARLTEQLVTFSHQQHQTAPPLDLGAAVRDAATGLASVLGPGVDLRVAVADHPLWVGIAPHLVERILTMLAVNANEAMPHGGSLTISVQPVQPEPAPARTNGDGLGEPFACLTVADTGVGMDEGTRQRAFEPFFSTKGLGSGTATGMGLAIVHGIVSQLNGRVQVESSPGQGSTFRVLLPLTDPMTAPAPPASHPPSE